MFFQNVDLLLCICVICKNFSRQHLKKNELKLLTDCEEITVLKLGCLYIVLQGNLLQLAC